MSVSRPTVAGAVRRLVVRGALLLAAMAIFAIFVGQSLAREGADDARIPGLINLAGRQRYLVSHTAMLALLHARSARLVGDNASGHAEVDGLLERLEANQQMLARDAERRVEHGDQARTTAFAAVTPLLAEFRETVKQLSVATPDPAAASRAEKRLARAEHRLVDASDRAVATLQATAQQHLLSSGRDQQRLLVTACAALLLFTLLVVAPAVRDLSQIIRGEQESRSRLAESEAELRAMAEQVPVAVVRTDAAGALTYVNSAYYALTGLSESEAQGAGWRMAVHPDDVDRVTTGWLRAASNGEPFATDFRLRRADGVLREVFSSTAPVVGRDGLLLGHVASLVDVTERKALLRDLEYEGAFHRGLVEGTPYAVIATAPDGTIVSFNPAAEELLGYRSEEIVNRHTPGIFHDTAEIVRRATELSALLGETVEPGFKLFVALAARGATDEREWTYIRRDGERLPVLLTISAITSSAGQVIGYLGIARDMRGQRAREAERDQQLELLRAAEHRALAAVRLKAAFMANMSHEIRTPMNAIMGFTDLVLEHSTLDAFQRDSLETVHRAADHLLHLIDDVLDFSKIEAGQMRVECIDFALPDVLADVVALLKPRAEAKGLRLSVVLDPALEGPCVGDPTRIRQVLTNFVGNAIKFTSIGHVTLHASRMKDEMVRLAVADSGIGISEDAAAKIFQPFIQAEMSTTRQFGGTGLGLSIARELTELMGGTVGVQSIPGVGSTFWCELPLHTTQPLEGSFRAAAMPR